MNPIQAICMTLSMTQLSGSIDGPIHFVEELPPEVESLTFWDLMRSVKTVEIESFAKHDVEPHRRNTFVQAKLFFENISEPLILDTMPAHMVFPRMPEQIFEKVGNGWVVKKNQYIALGHAETCLVIMNYYMALSKLISYSGPEDGKVIEKITLNIKKKTYVVDYMKGLNDEKMSLLKSNIDNYFASGEYVDHFINNFMGGMLHKSKHEPYMVEKNGQSYMQNNFNRVDWDQDDKKKSLKDVLPMLSFDSSPGCPAYISHYARLDVYAKDVLATILTVDFPLTKAGHGIDVENFGQLFVSVSGDYLVEYFSSALLEALEKQNLNFGDLLSKHSSKNSILA
jgi:hypothetical protein